MWLGDLLCLARYAAAVSRGRPYFALCSYRPHNILEMDGVNFYKTLGIIHIFSFSVRQIRLKQADSSDLWFVTKNWLMKCLLYPWKHATLMAAKHHKDWILGQFCGTAFPIHVLLKGYFSILVIFLPNFILIVPLDNKSMLDLIMTCTEQQVTSHYLNRWWPGSLTHICVNKHKRNCLSD